MSLFHKAYDKQHEPLYHFDGGRQLVLSNAHRRNVYGLPHAPGKEGYITSSVYSVNCRTRNMIQPVTG